MKFRVTHIFNDNNSCVNRLINLSRNEIEFASYFILPNCIKLHFFQNLSISFYFFCRKNVSFFYNFSMISLYSLLFIF